MAELVSDDKPLPQFRKDLEIFEGPNDFDGSPTYNLYDVLKAKYYKISWAESLIFKYLKPDMTLSELHRVISEKSTLKVSEEEIKFFFLDAFRHDLLAVPKNPEYFEKIYDKKHTNFLKWLLFNYLYIRIPLINPDPFLSHTIKYVRFLGSSIAFIIYAVLCFTGILMLYTRFGEFIHTFTYFFNFEGLFAYALAITTVKIIHEFSHAYTAKNYDVYVPSMGIALIVLWPVLYTDVTDGWKLKSRKKRLYISSAGIIAELIIAGLCTIGWYFSPEGLLQSVFFVIASITWVSTLIINLNPAVRFDGYYILCDLCGIDNLQQRAFNVTRWKFRDWFLGLKTPPPEEKLHHERIAGFVIYSVYTWIYRIVLYTAIAVFVYHKFTKALGVFLFILEIGVFLVWPITSELKSLVELRKYFNSNPRIMITLAVLLTILGWFIIPLPHMVKFPAITMPLDFQIIYIPEDSIIEKIYVKRDQEIKKDSPIITLVSPSIDHEVAKLDYEKQILEKQIYLLSFTDKDRAYIPEKKAELASNNERLNALKNKENEFQIKAKLDGKIYLWDDKLFEGMNIAKDSVIGKIADPKSVEIIAFVPEVDLGFLKIGNSIKFRVPSTNEFFYGKILSINPVRTEVLKQFALASTYHGDLAVSEDPHTKELRMIDTYYTVKILLDKPESQLRFGQTGYIETEGPWKSKLMSGIREVTRVFLRESGF